MALTRFHCVVAPPNRDTEKPGDHSLIREQGDAGGYAATGISSTSRSMSGYQRLKMALSSPFSVRTRVCNNKCAPSLDPTLSNPSREKFEKDDRPLPQTSEGG